MLAEQAQRWGTKPLGWENHNILNDFSESHCVASRLKVASRCSRPTTGALGLLYRWSQFAATQLPDKTRLGECGIVGRGGDYAVYLH